MYHSERSDCQRCQRKSRNYHEPYTILAKNERGNYKATHLEKKWISNLKQSAMPCWECILNVLVLRVLFSTMTDDSAKATLDIPWMSYRYDSWISIGYPLDIHEMSPADLIVLPRCRSISIGYPYDYTEKIYLVISWLYFGDTLMETGKVAHVVI